jgi:hypothetical protein
MSPSAPATLQISLAPSDWRLADVLLPHQLRAWKDQFAEILLTIDTRKSAGRFGEDWEQGRRRILNIAENSGATRILEVDYSEDVRRAVADQFFAGKPVPNKDCRGGPYYSYFFGLHAAAHDWVFHTDADMFFGGSSSIWIAEAQAVLTAAPGLVVAAPLPGPPGPSGQIRQLQARPALVGDHSGFLFDEMSTRVFFFQKSKWKSALGPLSPERPPFKKQLLALLDGNPARELPEVVISHAMGERGCRRFDFLGSAGGRWTLHPPYRGEEFYRKLPQLVESVESGKLPEAQLGDHDINDSLVDWTEPRRRLKEQRWWRRMVRRVLTR